MANALADMNLGELTSLPNWSEAVEIAVRDLPLPGQATSLLESWLERADQNLHFFDFALYRLVRYLPEGHPVRNKWESKALALATETRDFSLVESLILTLQNRALAQDQLMAIAKSFAESSSQMRRVLWNACNVKIDVAQQPGGGDAVNRAPHP